MIRGWLQRRQVRRAAMAAGRASVSEGLPMFGGTYWPGTHVRPPLLVIECGRLFLGIGIGRVGPLYLHRYTHVRGFDLWLKYGLVTALFLPRGCRQWRIGLR